MSAFTAKDWAHHSGVRNGCAHVYLRSWARTLCGKMVMHAALWEPESKRRQCGSCKRRIDNAKHWMHLLLERGP